MTAHSSGRQHRLPRLCPSMSAPASSNRRATSARPGARAGSRWKREAHARCSAVQPLPGSTRVAAPGSRRSSASTRSSVAEDHCSRESGLRQRWVLVQHASGHADLQVDAEAQKPHDVLGDRSVPRLDLAHQRRPARLTQLARQRQLRPGKRQRCRDSREPRQRCRVAAPGPRASSSFARRRAWSRSGCSGSTDMTSPLSPGGPRARPGDGRQPATLRPRGELSSARGPGGALTRRTQPTTASA